MLLLDASIAGGGVGTITLTDTHLGSRGIYHLSDGGIGATINAKAGWYRQGGITPMIEDQKLNGSIVGTVETGDIIP